MEGLIRLITDAHAFDHEPVSHPGGVQVQQAYRSPLRGDVAQTLLVYSVDINRVDDNGALHGFGTGVGGRIRPIRADSSPRDIGIRVPLTPRQ